MTYTRSVPLASDVCTRLRQLVDQIGDLEATRRLNVGRGTVARALAGLPLRRSSSTAIAASLRLLDLEQSAA